MTTSAADSPLEPADEASELEHQAGAFAREGNTRQARDTYRLAAIAGKRRAWISSAHLSMVLGDREGAEEDLDRAALAGYPAITAYRAHFFSGTQSNELAL